MSKVVEAIGPYRIVEIEGLGHMAVDMDVIPAKALTGLVTFEEARAAVADALEPHCTCGAREYRGCFCNLTIAEFMKSPHAKGI